MKLCELKRILITAKLISAGFLELALLVKGISLFCTGLSYLHEVNYKIFGPISSCSLMITILYY